jgi:hypothetical protein
MGELQVPGAANDRHAAPLKGGAFNAKDVGHDEQLQMRCMV